MRIFVISAALFLGEPVIANDIVIEDKQARKGYERYLKESGNKAFAWNNGKAWGAGVRSISVELAQKGAMKRCKTRLRQFQGRTGYKEKCKIVQVNPLGEGEKKDGGYDLVDF